MPDKRWKVLTVVEATAAGVGRHVSDLTGSFDLDRFDHTVAWSPLRSDDNFRSAVKAMEARGIKTHAIPMNRGVNPLKDFPALAQLTRLIAREQFDLVHAHSSKAGFLGRVAARLARPSAVTVYSPNAISISLSKLYWYPEKLAGWFTDALVAVTESERRELIGYGLVPNKKVVCVTAGIPAPQPDRSLTAEFRRHLALPEDALLIGTVGRVSFQKDPQTFLDAAAMVISRDARAYFVWIGPGEDLERSKEQAELRGLGDRVRFLGYRSDAQQMLQAVDIFALTSRYESFGYVTCEAMAYGRPVVATRVTGSMELVKDGETGFLVAPGDAEAFADALQAFLNSSHLRREFGAAGKSRVENHFSLKRMVSETEQLYLTLLLAKRRSAAGSILHGVGAAD